MTRFLMVCLGNICRSPLAEGILKSKLDPQKFIVDSAGTSNYHIGQQPDSRSIHIAKKFNIDITDQRGRQFEIQDFDRFDHIYVMDRSNYDNVTKLARNAADTYKVQLILDELSPGNHSEVPDPYYGGENGFEAVFKMLDQACNIIAKNTDI